MARISLKSIPWLVSLIKVVRIPTLAFSVSNEGHETLACVLEETEEGIAIKVTAANSAHRN